MNKILIIDNYDSFTWNLYQYFRLVGDMVIVRRNDDINIRAIERLSPSHLVISPGPGQPENAGVSLEVIYYFHDKIPILGVCLGHQAIAEFFGAQLQLGHNIIHGKSVLIHHSGSGIFFGLVRFLSVVRYNSLVINPNTLPVCLDVTAWSVCLENTSSDIMAIRHRDFPIEGVQFHPESILSEFGHRIFMNFMNY